MGQLEAMICKSCGAQLTSSKCEYCGTVYKGFEEPGVILSEDTQRQALDMAKSSGDLLTPNEMRKQLGLSTVEACEGFLRLSEVAGKFGICIHHNAPPGRNAVHIDCGHHGCWGRA